MFVASAFAQTTGDAATAGPDETIETIEATNGHGVEPAGFPPFDTSTYPSQLLWLAITFGLFYLFMQRVVLPRIGGILEVRSDRIAQDLDQAARMKEEADAAIAAYEQELAQARSKANEIGQQARDEAKADAEAERRTVEAELEGRLAEAEERIRVIKETAMRDIGAIAADTAGAIVQEIGGAKATKAEIEAAVGRAGS